VKKERNRFIQSASNINLNDFYDKIEQLPEENNEPDIYTADLYSSTASSSSISSSSSDEDPNAIEMTEIQPRKDSRYKETVKKSLSHFFKNYDSLHKTVRDNSPRPRNNSNGTDDNKGKEIEDKKRKSTMRFAESDDDKSTTDDSSTDPHPSKQWDIFEALYLNSGLELEYDEQDEESQFSIFDYCPCKSLFSLGHHQHSTLPAAQPNFPPGIIPKPHIGLKAVVNAEHFFNLLVAADKVDPKEKEEWMEIQEEAEDEEKEYIFVFPSKEEKKDKKSYVSKYFNQLPEPNNSEFCRKAYRKPLIKAFREFYRSISLLLNYSKLNSEGFEKITKKFDKKVGTHVKPEIMGVIESHSFFQGTQIRILEKETERLFCNSLYPRRRRKGMDKIRVAYKKSNVAFPTFLLGTTFGGSIFLLLMSIFLIATSGWSELKRIEEVGRVFRCLGLCVWLVWMWGVDAFLWDKERINYRFMLKLNLQKHYRYQQLFKEASILTFLWLLLFGLYVMSQTSFGALGDFEMPIYVTPLILVIGSSALFLKTQFSSKFWLLKRSVKIVGSPFFKVELPDFFVADQFASLVVMFIDLQYTVCFFFYDMWKDESEIVCPSVQPYITPFIAALPYWWRFLQCLRRFYDGGDQWQLANAGKYMSSIGIVMSSSLRALETLGVLPGFPTWTVLWVVTIAIGTTYTYSWDIKKDWSLGANPKHIFQPKKFVRVNTVYPYKWYYFAMASNLILRLTWTLTISASFGDIFNFALALPSIIAVLELIRRAQWNIFRLENEQLNNVGKYRAVDFVPLPGIDIV